MMIKRTALIFLLLAAAASSLFAQADPDFFAPKTIKVRMEAVAEWQLGHPNHQLYDWTNGAFYAGVFAAYETTKSPELLKALTDMGEKNQWKPGPRFDHADDIAISQTYIDLYRLKKDRKLIQPTI